MQNFITIGAAGWLLATACHATAHQALMPIHSATSTLRTTMKVTSGFSSSSTDTVPVSGFLLCDLDTNGTPTRISIRHFDIHALRTLCFTNTILFLPLYTTITNVQVFNALPGPQTPYFPVTSGSFTTTNTSFLVRGEATYTGVASGSYDLDSISPQSLASCSGTWQTVNGTNQVHLEFTFIFPPLVVTNTLGEAKIDISGTGSLNASAPVNALPPPAPALACAIADQQCIVVWPSPLWPTPVAANTPAGYWLYRTADLTSPSGWEPEPTPVRDNGAASFMLLPVDAAHRFYRLEWR